jgi:hypothetical protein
MGGTAACTSAAKNGRGTEILLIARLRKHLGKPKFAPLDERLVQKRLSRTLLKYMLSNGYATRAPGKFVKFAGLHRQDAVPTPVTHSRRMRLEVIPVALTVP